MTDDVTDYVTDGGIGDAPGSDANDGRPPGATVAWFHCFSGIAGDMAMGSLIDAGADVDAIREMCARLAVDGWELETEEILRCGIAGTKVHVHARDTTTHRTAGDITAMVDGADLPDRVRLRALATFDALAVAEGRLHRRPPRDVHFHEVGSIDAIVDVVGTCAALELLGIDEIRSSPVANGLGTVRAAHGVLPVPAPAVVELLRGAPTYSLDIDRELTTPTGAALLAANVSRWGPMPEMTITASGFGAGSAEFEDRPNLTQVIVGTDPRVDRTVAGQPVTLLEANVDDVTGEQLAHTITALLDVGAHDAWITPIVMKKGRPAHIVSALADPAVAGRVARKLVAETGSLGVRGREMERWPQTRHFDEIEIDGFTVRVKVSAGRVKAEHDDVARVATATGRPLRDVVAQVERRWSEIDGTMKR